MIKGKRGSIYLGLAIALFLFITGVLILPFVTDDVTSTRTALNCAGAGISAGTKLSCLFVDSLTPYYIFFFTTLALGLLVGGGR